MISLDRLLQMMEREAKRLGSQCALAEAIGVTPPAVCAVMKRKKPPHAAILKYFRLTKRVMYAPSSLPPQ